MAVCGACPSFGGKLLQNGNESYSNIPQARKETGPPGISGVAQQPLGLTKRIITVTGVMEGGVDGFADLAAAQKFWEAKAETGVAEVYTTGNGRKFTKTVLVTITWGRIYGNAVSGKCDAQYTAVFEQIVPGET